MTRRYARQTCLPGVGAAGQARLAAARVLVVGAGGLGSALLPLLAGAGVGYLRIIDGDAVEESNLHRQTLYRTADIGRPKAEIAAQELTRLNPDCTVSPLVARLDPVLARDEVPQVDIVVDAADMFAVTYALSDLCAAVGKPFITASVQGLGGYAGGFCGGAPDYRCVFPDLPATLASCASTGVLGPAVATIGSIQAQMILAVLLGHDPSPLGQLVRVDFERWNFSGFRFDGLGSTEDRGPAVLGAADIAEDDLVVELRSEREAPGLPFAHAVRVSPDQIGTLIPPAGRRAVFVCATGLRAWHAARHVSARHGVTTGIVAML